MKTWLEKAALRCLHALPAEPAHNISLRLLPLAAKSGIIAKSHGSKPYVHRQLQFPNRIGLAAGFDKNADAIDALAACGFGFVECGTVTPKAQYGNAKPRMFRIARYQSLINRMGFNNKGVDYLVARLAHCKADIIKGVNIGKNSNTPLHSAHEDYLYCLEKVYTVADYVVINVSSPNTPQLRELQFGKKLDNLLAAIARCRSKLARSAQRDVPILLKIAPDVSRQQLVHIVRALKNSEMSGLIATNTSNQHPAHIQQITQQQGGLSGAALTARARKTLHATRELLPAHMLLIGCGGICSLQDAKEHIQAGADVIQLYTGFTYHGTALVREIAQHVADM